jgi:hypothetical protein
MENQHLSIPYYNLDASQRMQKITNLDTTKRDRDTSSIHRVRRSADAHAYSLDVP